MSEEGLGWSIAVLVLNDGQVFLPLCIEVVSKKGSMGLLGLME